MRWILGRGLSRNFEDVEPAADGPPRGQGECRFSVYLGNGPRGMHQTCAGTELGTSTTTARTLAAEPTQMGGVEQQHGAANQETGATRK
eukprot:6010447-Pyramimonas_sp.AAC.1